MAKTPTLQEQAIKRLADVLRQSLSDHGVHTYAGTVENLLGAALKETKLRLVPRK